MFTSYSGNWTDLRAQFNRAREDEIDLHFGRRDRWAMTYDDAMDGVAEIVLKSLLAVQKNKRPYVMFTHGWSTSRPGKTTARSVVRGIMRSREATPFIERWGCIQHEAAFVAKVQ
jgi:hypothetical protein